MTISSLDNYIAAAKQNLNWAKSGAITTVANVSFSAFAAAGDPGAGTLAGSSTTVGVVPVSADNGYPTINPFGAGNAGYVSRITATSSVACRIDIYDRLWVGGNYAFNANTAVTSPSWSSRVAGGTNFTGLELWAEQVTAGTGSQSFTVQYTDDADAAKTTPVQSAGAAAIVGRCTKIGLVAGGTSIKTITNVLGTVATVGTFNIMVLRNLGEIYLPLATASVTQDMLSTGLPKVYETSAIYCLITPLSTSTGIPMVGVEIANG